MMATRLIIKVGSLELEAELNDTGIANALWEALPLTAQGNRWGEEIYFSIPIEKENEDGVEVVGTGDLGYWPPGKAFCIFFGPTPISRDDEIRPASAVTVLGRVLSNLRPLRDIRSGAEVVLEAKPC